MKFKPGDSVKFKGLKVVPLGIVIKAVEGKLMSADHNTQVKGVMRIEGDIQGMLFMPDGTIYCHPQYGSVLKKPGQERKTKLQRK